MAALRFEDNHPPQRVPGTEQAPKLAVSVAPATPHHIPCYRDSDHVAMISQNTHSLDPSAPALRQGHYVVCSPEELRLHPALDKIGWTCTVDELNDASRRKELCVPEPILITTTGVILAGFGRWQLAILSGWHEIDCIEYALCAEESLQFLVTYHHRRRFFNAFVRISLALTLEPHFRLKALENMRSGGKYKGSAKLPEAQHIDVRKEIANIAGACGRNVANVRTIWDRAHPRLVEALIIGSLTINGAMQFCKWPKSEQLEQFIQYCEDRETDRVIRQAVIRSENENTRLDTATVLEALQQQEKRQPGSVVIRIGRLPHTVILIGRDPLTSQISQGKLNLA